MSQITTFDNPLNPGRSRGQAPQTGRQGIQVTPNAPGLVPLPPVSKQGSQLRQMIDAIGLAGQVASTAGRQADLEVRRREFKQQEFNRLYEAAASTEARLAIGEIEQQINNGEVEVPEGVEVGEFVKELARIRLPEDAPEAYQNRYKSILVPAVAERIIAKQTADIEQARSDSIQSLAEGAYSIATTPREYLDIVDEAKRIDPNLSDVEARQVVLLPALQVAIEQGNQTSFDMVAKALGSEFATTVARARVQLERQRLSNERQKKSEETTKATRIVDSLIDSPHLTDQMVKESIDDMDLDATVRATLKSRVNNRRAEQIAAERSNNRQLIETLKDAAQTPLSFRSRLTSYAEQLGLTEGDIDRHVIEYTQAQIELAANNGDLERIKELSVALGDGPESTLLIDQANEVAINNIRQDRFESMVTQIQTGEVDPEIVRQFVIQDARNAADNPDSPDVLNVQQREQLARSAGKKQQADLSQQRVLKVISGDGRTVITGQDNDAIDQIIGNQGEGGLGLIDENNNLTDPAGLGATLVALNHITPNTREVVMANLLTGQPDQQVQAINTIATIAQGKPALLQELAGDDMRAGAAIAEIRTLADRGVLETQPAIARERVGALLGSMSETTLNTRQVDQRLEDDKVNLDAQIATVAVEAAKLMPWKDTGFLDWEAGVSGLNNEADLFLRNRFKEQYFYQRNQGRSKEDAIKFARRTAQEMMIRDFDFVRYNGEMHVHRVTDGQRRMRDDYRWGGEHEEHINKFIKKSGFERDDVFTVRPAIGHVIDNQGRAVEGWLLIDHNLDPIMDDEGQILLWEPPQILWDRSMQARDLLETKEFFFDQKAPQRDRRPNGIDAFTDDQGNLIPGIP